MFNLGLLSADLGKLALGAVLIRDYILYYQLIYLKVKNQNILP
jgi:hypothetical protein